MKNNIYIFLLSLISLLGCQSSGTKFYNKDFKWQVTIPKNYESKPIVEKDREIGKKLIEEVYNQKVEFVTIPIFNYMKGKTSKFQAHYTKLDSTQNFVNEFNKANEIFQRAVQYRLPDSKLEVIKSTKIISGLEFKTFQMKVQEDNDSTTFQCFSRLFGDRKLDILIVYQDEISGNELLGALEKSNFE